MPELPEVETVLRGLKPHLNGQRIVSATVRNPELRWPVSPGLSQQLPGRTIVGLARRAKYLLLDCESGHLLLHLGMSGSLRIHDHPITAGKHDHFDLELANGKLLRLNDPRRFGAVLWIDGAPQAHPLLAGIGVEPLTSELNGTWLYQATRGRRAPIKAFLMDGKLVSGVGNIYANEALFHAGIHPKTAAGRLSAERCQRLSSAIKRTLRAAIRAGGSSLRNFVASDGSLGCFQQQYWVYGRGAEPCRRCSTKVKTIRQGGRATFYCPRCQRV